MRRRVMRRLVNTFLIEMNRPEGAASVPKVAVGRHNSASQPFGTLIAGMTVPKGLSKRLDFSTLTFETKIRPLGRFTC